MTGIRVGIIGAGKMGLSHYAIANALPGSAVVAVSDTSRYVLSVLRKYAGIETHTSYEQMIDEGRLDCIFVATPTSTHFECAKYALERDLHVFVEKPLTLSPAESRALADRATRRKRVNMVGVHNRFIGTFREAHRLLQDGALGTNWSDATVRKMSTTISVQLTKGELVVDRQELKVRCGAAFDGYQEGWNTRRITDLQDRVEFYLRGEEYTAQVAAFFSAIRSENAAYQNSFASAYETDRVLD